jgi:C4-dicarboxylate-specific signal transduction histidine kinase
MDCITNPLSDQGKVIPVNEELEKAKNSLDLLVKARTVELSATNERLLEEIKEEDVMRKNLKKNIKIRRRQTI